MTSAPQYKRTKNERVVVADEKYQAVASSSTSSSTTTVQVFPHSASETLRRYQLENLKELHAECLGRPMPAPISAELLRDLDDGTPSAYYKYAMREACYAPRPSWRYVQAIVRRCKAQMIEPSELEY